MSKKPRYPRPTDAEEAAINAGIALDPDNPEWTEADFKRAKPLKGVDPEFVSAILKARRQRGRPPLAAPKKLVSLRLSAEVIDHFKSTGPGWQTRIDQVLTEHIGQ